MRKWPADERRTTDLKSAKKICEHQREYSRRSRRLNTARLRHPRKSAEKTARSFQSRIKRYALRIER